MYLLLFFPLLVLPALSVLHEERRSIPSSYARSLDPPAPDTPLPSPLRFFLQQSNVHLGPSALLNVSSPSSPFFRKHWTKKQVDAFFAPEPKRAEAVERWLASQGIPQGKIRRSRSGGSVDVHGLSVSEAQSLLNTSYSVYTHQERGTTHLGCTEYHLPEEVAEHVDFVYPTLQFDGHAHKQGVTIPLSARESAMRISGQEPKEKKRGKVGLGVPGSGSLPKQGEQLSTDQLNGGISVCGEFIVPECLQELYNYPAPNLSAPSYPSEHLGIVEYTPQSYLPNDLEMFFGYYLSPGVGERPTLYSIDGGYPQDEYLGFEYQGESSLDLEYAMALSWPEIPMLYQVGDLSGSASFGNFLNALDGSYCGENDPSVDETFPNSYWPYPEDCGTVPQATVISTSYNYNEFDLPVSYMERQCHEYLKLGLEGITVVFSSGDYGVGGNMGMCMDDTTGNIDFNGSMFTPSFPSTCPWVLSVGATQIPYGTTTPFTTPEVACEDVIVSGGGFSNVFSRPGYQDDQVAGWSDNYGPVGLGYDYNTDSMRGYPDISANGAGYVVAADGEFLLLYGTSASAPVIASMLAKINSELASQGNAPIGFINSVIYANPDRVHDIISGSNPGCGTKGFSTTPGWDPVTGMGTLNFEKLLEFYMALG